MDRYGRINRTDITAGLTPDMQPTVRFHFVINFIKIPEKFLDLLSLEDNFYTYSKEFYEADCKTLRVCMFSKYQPVGL